jgi:hypothetical protein
LLALVVRQAAGRWSDAAAAAFLFAAMPVNWENVDWISGRTGLFMVVCGVLATLFWLKSMRGRPLWLLPAALAQAAALLCYEPAVIVPLALLAFVPALPTPWRRVVPGIAVLAGVTGLVWVLRSLVLGHAGVMGEVARARIWPGMARNLAGIVLHGWSDFGAVAFCITAVLLGAGLLSRLTRTKVAALLAAAFVLYLPFWTIAGVTERFFYAAGVPLAVALVVASAASPGLRPALLVLVALFAWRSHAQAEGVREAGARNRAMLAQIAALPPADRIAVFDAVPSHLGPYYLLWGAFETATCLVRPGAIAARSETVLADPALRRLVLAGPTRFMAFDAAANRFVDMNRAEWLARYPAAQSSP